MNCEKNRKIIEFLVGYITIFEISIIMVYDMVNNFMLKSLPDIELAYPAIFSVLLVLVSTILILYQFENREKLEKIEELSKYISSIVGHSESVKFFIKILMKLIIILSNEYYRLRKVFVNLTGKTLR